jgi:hypothetical protein
MVTFSVQYILNTGRSPETSKHVLSVEIDWIDEPKKFFLAIKELMRSQCDQHVTTQYRMIELCPAYIIEDMSNPFSTLSYQKFSDKFLKEVAKLRDPEFVSKDDEND